MRTAASFLLLLASAALAQTNGEVSVGAGGVSRDNLRFGQYTGMQDSGAYGLFDFNFSRRDEASGRLMRFSGSNLGLDSRELHFDHRAPGNWAYFIDFSQTPRLTPYTVNTGVQGIQSNRLLVQYPAGTGLRDVELRTLRDALTLGGSKSLGRGWEFQARFSHENKNGARPFGRGDPTAGGMEFLTEPIDYVTQQMEATLGFTGERLQLSGGYYGSFFRNENSALVITSPGGPAGPAALTPMGLPPDNHSHQGFLGGGFSLTPTTRANFKFAYARLVQTDPFIVAPAAGVGQTNLDGRLDTTQLQAGITSRPFRELGLRANFRIEDRSDKTPQRPYQTGLAATATTNGLNEPRSIRTKAGLLEGTYNLPLGFRVAAGAEYEQKYRNTSDIRIVSSRDRTEETTLRADFRRSISETVNGSIGLAHSSRGGSDWLTTTRLNGTNGSNLINPIHLADRDRDKVRAVVDWTPISPLALHLVAEAARDDYSGRALGPRNGRAQFYSADASWRFSEAWQATAWISRNDSRVEQRACEEAGASNTGTLAACPNIAADPIYSSRLRALTDSFGIGMRAKPTGVLEIGADLVYARDINEFRIDPLATGNTGVPDIRTTRTLLGAFASYALDKKSGVRVRYAFDRFSTDDYTWSLFTYSDGTTLRQDNVQRVHFIGAQYYHRFE